LGDKEIDAGSRILLPDFNQTGLDDVHRNAGRAFADNDFGRWEIGGFEAGSEF
jgi:hypothetical protein